MNRRGFIGALAALVPAVLLPKPEPYEWKAVGSPWITVHPSEEENVRKLLAASTKGMADEMSALGDSMGSSFGFVKSRTASEIMAKHDRRTIRRWRDYEKNQ